MFGARSITILATLCLPTLAAAEVIHPLETILQTKGIEFHSVLSLPESYTKGELDSVPPASVAKIFTAAAALDALGANYQFRTRVSWTRTADGTATNLVVTGSGDPTWGLEEFQETPATRFEFIAQHLKSLGVQKVAEPIRFKAVDPRLDQAKAPEGWESDDLAHCFGGKPETFNLSLNCVPYHVYSPTRGAWGSPEVRTPVTLHIAYGKRTSLKVRATPKGYVVEGTFSQKRKYPRTFYFPVKGTTSWMKDLLRGVFRNQGLTFLATDRAPRAKPSDVAEEIELRSPELREIVKPFAKQSLNFIGESLLLALGREAGTPGELRALGLEKIRAYLGKTPGAKDVVVKDGCGLSRDNRVNARFVHDFLIDELKQAHFPDFLAMLAVAGVDGTLKNRMKNTVAQGRLFAKTGTIDEAHNLAGYTVREGKDGSPAEYAPFVILSTGLGGKRANERIDAAGVKIASLLNPNAIGPATLPVETPPTSVEPPADSDTDTEIEQNRENDDSAEARGPSDEIRSNHAFW